MKPELAQKKLEQLKQRQQKRGGDFWKPSPGDNHVRFLPRWDGNYDGECFRETAYHRNLGSNKDQSAVCLKAEGQESCPVCEVVHELYKTKEKENADLAKTMRAFSRVAYNIIDLDEPEKGPQVYMSGAEVEEQVMRYIANPKYGDITDPHKGRNCTLYYKDAKESKSGFPQTDVQPDPETSPLEDMEWLDKMTDLDALVKPLSYKELYALVWGQEVSEDAPAEAPKQTPPKKDTVKKSCRGKFSDDDPDCEACESEQKEPCIEETKERKAKKQQEVKQEVKKPAPKAESRAESPKPSSNVKDMLDKLKKSKKE